MGGKIFSTGGAAVELQLSRDRVLDMIEEAGLNPQRDSSGRRLLTERDLRILQRRHAESQKRRVVSR